MVNYFLFYPLESVPTLVALFPISVMLYRMDYRDKHLKYIFWFFVAKFLCEGLMIYLASTKQNNLWIYNFYILISFLLLCKAFYDAFDFPVDKKLVCVISCVFVVVLVIDWMSVGMQRSMKITGSLECVFVILLIMRYFWEIVISLKVPDLLNYPFFWACCGLLCYYSSLTFVAPLHNILNRSGATMEFHFLYAIPAFVDIFYLLILSIAFLRSD